MPLCCLESSLSIKVVVLAVAHSCSSLLTERLQGWKIITFLTGTDGPLTRFQSPDSSLSLLVVSLLFWEKAEKHHHSSSSFPSPSHLALLLWLAGWGSNNGTRRRRRKEENDPYLNRMDLIKVAKEEREKDNEGFDWFTECTMLYLHFNTQLPLFLSLIPLERF